MKALAADDLMDIAQHNGVHVRMSDLGDISGEYDDRSRTITVHLCLTQYQLRSTLAHELSHAHHRDRPVRDADYHNARERRADSDAAKMLINPREYAEAESMVGPHPGAIAVELGVTRRLVEAFQREYDHGRQWTQIR